jgi:3-deoxy-D-manno-octulosonic-acid transferase
LSVIFYNIFLGLFRIGTVIASLFNPKIKKWVQGRKQIFDKLQSAIPSNSNIIWMHCASVGEFEQGRPIIESLKSNYPDYKILLTFFSPSGFEATQNYKGADWIFYLPLDGANRSKKFLEIVQPQLVIFVKYEFWFYYLKKIKYRNIPLILVSALFTKKMSFFKWYGRLQRKMLTRFDQIFVQNESSKKLLEAYGFSQLASVSGDTRFDRVLEIASNWEPLPQIEKFIGNNKVIVAGSTWPEDENMLLKFTSQAVEKNLKLIIAPHEIDEKHLTEIKNNFFKRIILL